MGSYTMALKSVTENGKAKRECPYRFEIYVEVKLGFYLSGSTEVQDLCVTDNQSL